ncbi:hypothetical protein OOK44_30825 [Streptomyces cellulosae]|uniref:Uncharacterized protein n=2 Tax=Streptomyces TaxID=1883 RepID=A0ABU3JAC0_9ACTN|nr:hypothetical protein [Streptomyces sp. McG7]MBT2905006.1 hypothetical protein [Streptomyces sp. McG8]MCX4480780.1 hypothetical protein [Streptomyces cellulosae]MDQ0490425.1 hypothetical protein [Streptomyces thermodiastaticus]MDT6970973.1 hypothetical protein [Streptomyces thermocarboxydus]MXQ61340.1 hypothetical protein [Streptomyces sp. XHT-2]MYQ32861.1 hypothetical protein [Streptomyces sp. SID4956]MYW54529.1 hypothetical protein [Streptomyces sp. SID8376]THC58909.1 hypothetical prote
MTDHRLEGPGENGVGVPRDLPDQQAGPDEDPWEVAPAAAQRESERKAEESDGPDSEEDVPDTDEAGTGRQGAPHSAASYPEAPVPDESTG